MTYAHMRWVLVAAMILTACSPGESPATPHRTQPAPERESFLAAAVLVTADYLSYTEEGAAPDYQLGDRLLACERESTAPYTLWMAGFRIIGAEVAGDTAIVRAAIVSVATQRESSQDALRFEVEPMITVDTLSWNVVRRGHDSAGICGYSREGPDIGSFGRSDNVRFLGGATRVSLLAQIDSVRAVRDRQPGLR